LTMGGGIDRDRLELRAQADGSVTPIPLLFSKAVLGCGDGGNRGVVLLALETSGGSRPFDCVLLDANVRDVLEGAGRVRKAGTRDRTLIGRANGEHPIISLAEELSFEIEGRMAPGSTVFVSFTYADPRPTPEGDDRDERIH